MVLSIVTYRQQHPCPTNLHGLGVELYLPYPEGDNRKQHPCPTNLHGLGVELYLSYPEGDNRQHHPCPTNLDGAVYCHLQDKIGTALHINRED
jgi:hypothetical protein